MSVLNTEFFEVNTFVKYIKLNIVKYIKLFKFQGTGCYDINVTFRSSPRDGLLEFVKFEFGHFSNFFCI